MLYRELNNPRYDKNGCSAIPIYFVYSVGCHIERRKNRYRTGQLYEKKALSFHASYSQAKAGIHKSGSASGYRLLLV